MAFLGCVFTSSPPVIHWRGMLSRGYVAKTAMHCSRTFAWLSYSMQHLTQRLVMFYPTVQLCPSVVAKIIPTVNRLASQVGNLCIQIQTLQTHFNTFPWRIRCENLFEDQSIFHELISLLVLTTIFSWVTIITGPEVFAKVNSTQFPLVS